VISADTSYSRFTQYSSADLPILHTFATTGHMPLSDEPAAAATAWMSYEKYLSTLPKDDNDDKGPNPPSEKANTRSTYQVNEVVVLFDTPPTVRGLPHEPATAGSPGAPRASNVRTGGFGSPPRRPQHPSATTASSSIGSSVLQPPRTARSSVFSHGKLSCGGIPYANYLQPATPPTLPDSAPTSPFVSVFPVPSHEEQHVSAAYVGKRTSGNWYVKVAPVLISGGSALSSPNSARRPASGTRSLLASGASGGGGAGAVGEALGEEGYAMLAYSEGFDFKARLISLTDLSTESFY
jgi:hypothetical protein